MTTRYYQVGGYRPDIHWYAYDEKQLSEVIGGVSSPLRMVKPSDCPLELILGIKPHGSSHLLLTVDQTRQVASAMRLPLPRNHPLTSRDFESLSPIYFASAKEVEDKLSSLKQKSKKATGQGQSGDTSKANRGYAPGMDHFGRGAFEHGRVLYRILGEKINPHAYGVDNTSWTKDLEIYSLVINTLDIDNRPIGDRLRRPHVLDIGFCRATLPELLPLDSSSRHIVPIKNSFLGKKAPKRAFKYGQTESLDAITLPKAIQDIFRSFCTPSILLVSNKEETLNYLKGLEVDTSEWESDVKGLLYPPSPRTSRNDFQHNAASSQRKGPRSRSPDRGSDSYYGKERYYTPPSHSSRPPENRSWRPTYAPVYVVDVRQWYNILMQRQDVKRSVDIALRLHLTEDSGWCAGNEAPLLIDIWRLMVSGSAIDEQRELRDPASQAEEDSEHQQVTESGPSSAPGLSAEADSDEEDPNISLANAQASSHAQPQAPTGGGLDMDESDYGESDSD